MENRIKELGVQIKSIKKELIDYFRNKQIPLQERWRNYCFAIKEDVFSEVKSYYWDSKVLEKAGIEWCMIVHDRHEMVNLSWIIEHWQIDDAIIAGKLNEDELKEEILKSGYSAFVYDW